VTEDSRYEWQNEARKANVAQAAAREAAKPLSQAARRLWGLEFDPPLIRVDMAQDTLTFQCFGHGGERTCSWKELADA
jgi:hypothetical protein